MKEFMRTVAITATVTAVVVVSISILTGDTLILDD